MDPDVSFKLLLQGHARLPAATIPTTMGVDSNLYNCNPQINAFFISFLGHGILLQH